MSGGRWNYENDNACREVFGWSISADYDLAHPDTMAMSKIARRLNPLEDRAISELVYDVFCLLHSHDWYASGDTGEETYRADLKYFKKKWLSKTSATITRREVNEMIDEFRADIMKTLDGLLPEDSDVHDV